MGQEVTEGDDGSSIRNQETCQKLTLLSDWKQEKQIFEHLTTIYNRVIGKVRKAQHENPENPEFGHTQREIQNKPAKKPSILVVN